MPTIGSEYTFSDGRKVSVGLHGEMAVPHFFLPRIWAALATAVQFSPTTTNWQQKYVQ
jgi:hypothetical protein